MILLCIPEFSINAEESFIHTEDLLITGSDYDEIQPMIEKIEAEVPGAEFLYEKAVRIYVDTDVISLNSEERDVILDTLKTANYVWIIPYVNGEEIGSVTLGRGLPLNEDVAHLLTKEEQEEIRQNVGKWCINAVSYGGVEAYYDQITEKAANIPGCSRVVILGSQPGMRYPMALAFDENKAIAWISLGFGYAVLDNVPTTLSNEENIYDFSAIAQEAVLYVGADSQDRVGGEGTKAEPEATEDFIIRYFVIGMIFIVLIASIAGGIFLYKKKTRKY